MKNETISVDDIECPWCGKKFDGENATNYDTSCNYVKCPECGKGICVMQSIEYTCYRQADQDLEEEDMDELDMLRSENEALRMRLAEIRERVNGMELPHEYHILYTRG